jgi:hypothetical protein
MRIRSVIAVLCVSVAGYVTAPLLAFEPAPSVCCATNDDCAGQVCCDPVYLGLPDCADGAPGYCKATCIPGSSLH